MADVNIKTASVLAGTSIASTDRLPLGDVSADAWVPITMDELQTALSRVGTGGTLYVRQLGGTPGTDEIQISHNGSLGLVDSKDGGLTLKVSGLGDLTLDAGGAGSIIAANGFIYKGNINGWNGNQIGFAYPGDVSNTSGLKSTIAKIISITDGSTGGGTLASTMLTPVQITSNQNDYAPGAARYYRLSSDASRNITGFAGDGVGGRADGQECCLINVGSFDIVLKHQDAASTAALRFLNKSGADYTLPPNGMVGMVYDATTLRWRVAA